MGRRRTYAPLAIFINSRLVGRIERGSSGAVSFAYAPEWLFWEHAFPISLSLPLREQRHHGRPVLAVLENLLPDAEPLRRQIAERVEAEGSDPYSLLAKVGRDCVGALQFLPDGENPGPPGQVSGTPIDDAGIAYILKNLAKAPLGMGVDGPEFRISIAGAHEKTALLRLGGKWHVPRGTTATTHILKPPIGIVGAGLDLRRSVENEFLSLAICRALALPTADASIEDFKGKRALVVERFDRVWDGKRLLRLPQEDFCQATSTPPSRKYEADGGPGMVRILELLRASNRPLEDQRLFLKTQVVFWLLAVIDGHAKNFSIHLMPGGGFRLAPLYDVLSAWPAAKGPHLHYKKAKLAMAVGKNRHYKLAEIRRAHFEQTCALARVPARMAREIMDEIADTAPAAVSNAISSLPPGFPSRILAPIRDGFLTAVRTKLKP